MTSPTGSRVVVLLGNGLQVFSIMYLTVVYRVRFLDLPQPLLISPTYPPQSPGAKCPRALSIPTPPSTWSVSCIPPIQHKTNLSLAVGATYRRVLLTVTPPSTWTVSSRENLSQPPPTPPSLSQPPNPPSARRGKVPSCTFDCHAAIDMFRQFACHEAFEDLSQHDGGAKLRFGGTSVGGSAQNPTVSVEAFEGRLQHDGGSKL